MGAAFTPGGTRLTAYPIVTIGSDGQISRSGPVFPEYRGCDCRLVPWRNLERMRKESLALYAALEDVKHLIPLRTRDDPYSPPCGSEAWFHYHRGYECAADDYYRTVEAKVDAALRLARGEGS